MASPMVTVLNAIESEWEALTPPDRTTSAYRRTDGPDTHEGTSGDRVFWFEVAGGSPTDERGAAMTEYEHNFEAKLRLMADGYLRRDLEARIVNEAMLLMRAVDKKTEHTWGSGITNVITKGYSTTRSRDEVLLTMPMTAFTQETD
jgi:hypothetical protein